jgi:uncharacterized protein
MTDPVVDVERHVLVRGLDDLLPHLPQAWRHRFTESEFVLPPTGPHPGVEIERHQITDGFDAEATAAALDPDTLAALLIAPQTLVTSGWLGHDAATTFHRAVNDYLVDRWLPADHRFHLAVSVSVQDIDAAVAEVRRLGDHPGIAAVTTSLIAVNMGHKHYHPLYAACAERGLPLVVHPGGFEGSVVGPAALGGVGPRTPEETFTLLPQVAMSNLSSMLFDGVFSRYPDLTVVFAGFGYGWVPPVLWRADSEWRGLRTEVPWLAQPPSEVAAEHVRFVVDGACETAGPGAWELAAMLPEQMLLFGSDAPYVPDPAATIAGVPAGLRDPVRHANALAAFPRLHVDVAA